MGVFCRAFCGAACGLRLRESSAFRGDRPCRLQGSTCRTDRAAALLVTALTANVKLPVTHVEASQKALEQLRANGNVNSAAHGQPWHTVLVNWRLDLVSARGQWLYAKI